MGVPLLAGLMPPLSGVGSFDPWFAAGTLCGSRGHRGGFGLPGPSGGSSRGAFGEHAVSQYNR